VGELKCSCEYRNLLTGRRIVVSFTTGSVTAGERTPVHFIQKAGCNPELVWTLWTRERRFPDRPVSSLVVVLTELPSSR
jgi:hypothetical protein